MDRIKNYVNGAWVESSTERFLDIEDPGTGELLAQVPMTTREEVNSVVTSARSAFETWKEVPPTERVSYIFKLKNLLEENLEEIAILTTKEHGKTLDEARGDTTRLLENVDASLGIPSLMQGNIQWRITPDIDEYFIREPLGVFTGISPFNFPGMIPFWYLPYAIALGNTFIVKPSEQTPLTMTTIFELINEVGFPKGTVNLVHGDKETVDALLEHPDIAGICSVTSTPTAEYIYEKCGMYKKRPLCQAGAKNYLVVMPDAVLSKAVPNIINSFFGNTGQRCLAGGNLVAVDNVYTALVEEVQKEVAKIKVGYGLDPKTTMGPVISQQAKERIEGHIERGIKEGAKLLIDGRTTTVEDYPNGHYLGPSVFDKANPGMAICQQEIFGPVMPILRVKNLDEAIGLINERTDYGNTTSIFTSSGGMAHQFQREVNCGMVGINIGVVAPVAWFPFGGKRKSFFGILHGQLPDVIDYFTDKKVIIERWW
jgi:malonate-semialdehyde dehydrogenase (acetylating)/methylmalonate-semialdehyde dehydrogenase